MINFTKLLNECIDGRVSMTRTEMIELVKYIDNLRGINDQLRQQIDVAGVSIERSL